MKKLVKWTAVIILFLVICLTGIVIILPKLLNPNDYKDKISEQVYKKSGLQLKIPGDIVLSVSPRLQVLFALGKIELQAVDNTSDAPLLQSDEVEVRLSLWPLISNKKLAIQGIKLHGVHCALSRDKNGRGNWENPDKVKTAPASPQQKKNVTSTKTVTLPALELGSFDLSDVTIRYQDKQAGKIFAIKNLYIQTNNIRDNSKFHLQSGFIINSTTDDKSLTVENTINSDVLISQSRQTLQLTDLSITSVIKGLTDKEHVIKLSANTSLNLKEERLILEHLVLADTNIRVELDSEINNFTKPEFKGKLNIPQFSLTRFLKDNDLPLPAWKNDNVLEKVTFSCRFSGDMKKVDISAMDIILDDSHGRGSLAFLNLSQPAFDFKMHFDRLDIDHYATGTRQDNKIAADGELGETANNTKQTTTSAGESSKPLFPVELLRKLHFNLDLGVDDFIAGGARLSQVTLNSSAENGELALEPLSAKLYGGSITGKAHLDVRGKTPQLNTDIALDNVQIGPLLTDVTGKEEVTGTAIFTMQIRTKGNSRQQLTGNADGSVKTALKNGVIKKLHILQVVRQAKAVYEKELPAKTADDEPTGFARIRAGGKIVKGILYNNNLRADSELMNVTGAGKIDFTRQYVDYLLKVALTKGLERNRVSGKSSYSKFIIPYKIHGTFSDLKEEADVVGLFKEEAKTFLIEKLQDQFNKNSTTSKTKPKTKKNSSGDLLQKGFNSLFK